MKIVPAVAVKIVASGKVGSLLEGAIPLAAPEPGKVCLRPQALGVLATVLTPLDVGIPAQDASALLAAGSQLGLDERAHVQPHSIVDVRVPSDRLLVHRLPAHEDVVGRLPGEDLLELALQVLGRAQASIRAFFTFPLVGPLPLDPVAEVGVGESFESASPVTVRAGKLMVVHEGVKAILSAIPDVPDEGTVMKELAVFLEELLSKPSFERVRVLLTITGGSQEFAFPGG